MWEASFLNFSSSGLVARLLGVSKRVSRCRGRTPKARVDAGFGHTDACRQAMCVCVCVCNTYTCHMSGAGADVSPLQSSRMHGSHRKGSSRVHGYYVRSVRYAWPTRTPAVTTGAIFLPSFRSGPFSKAGPWPSAVPSPGGKWGRGSREGPGKESNDPRTAAVVVLAVALTSSPPKAERGRRRRRRRKRSGRCETGGREREVHELVG